MTRRVVVTGGSCISALGSEMDEIFDSLKKLENKVVRMDEWDKYVQMNTRLAVPVNYQFPEMPRRKVRGMGRVALLATVGAQKALECSGLLEDQDFLHSGRVGVAYGSSMGSVMPLVDFFSMIVTNDSSKITATTYIKSMPQTCFKARRRNGDTVFRISSCLSGSFSFMNSTK